MRIRIDRRKRGRGRFQPCLKLILRDLLPGNRSIVSQIVSGPLGQRSLFGAARLPIPDRPIRNAPILRHTLMLTRTSRVNQYSNENRISGLSNACIYRLEPVPGAWHKKRRG